MAKIMLVEDDKSLREIYSIRLVAEGYEVASAGDGEEALAIAVQQRPDLILSDVMMPKISGFDMLDILRSTPETKDIKVIMMTALSSDEQRQRGETLGADKYLVKSQVGIEDVINAIHEILGDKGIPAAAPQPAAQPAQTTAAPAQPAQPVAQPQPVAPVQSEPAVTPAQPVPQPISQPAQPEQPVAAVQPEAQSAPQPEAPVQDTGAQMEAILNENSGTPNAAWPGTPAQ